MKFLRPLVLSLSLVLAAAVSVRAADPVPAVPATVKPGFNVVVEVNVKEDGEVESAKFVSSDDPSVGHILSELAINMALQAKLPPRQKDGKPVRYKARMPFAFPVEGDEGPAADNPPKPRLTGSEVAMPVFPEALAAQSVAGGAIFEFVLSAQGQLERLTLLRASHPEFAAAAETAIRKWTFLPAQQDGQPVATRLRLSVVFDNVNVSADWPWRVAPRPSFGSFVVRRADPAAPSAAPKLPAEPTVPSALAPTK